MFCRQKRIVKRTNFDGSVDYVGQTKTFWGNWEDGYGPRTSKHYKTYNQALEWYNERGTKFSTNEVMLSDDGGGPKRVGKASYESNSTSSFHITEEMIEKYRDAN
jgi:hypothetical protein